MSRGTLRVYLGAAPGVGKTFTMLNEGHRRRERGADVVVGIVWAAVSAWLFPRLVRWWEGAGPDTGAGSPATT